MICLERPRPRQEEERGAFTVVDLDAAPAALPADIVLLECVTLLKHIMYCPPGAAAAAAAATTTTSSNDATISACRIARGRASPAFGAAGPREPTP